MDRTGLIARKLAEFENVKWESLPPKTETLFTGITQSMLLRRAEELNALLPDEEQIRKEEGERSDMKVIRLTHITGGGSNCIYDAVNCPALHEEIDEMQYNEAGEEWKLTVEEMSEDEFKALPEFEGW